MINWALLESIILDELYKTKNGYKQIEEISLSFSTELIEEATKKLKEKGYVEINEAVYTVSITKKGKKLVKDSIEKALS